MIARTLMARTVVARTVVARTVVARTAACIALLLAAAPIVAQPVGSVDVQFSTDDGATFADTALVDDMGTFLQRIYFDNTGDAPGTAASVSATLPAGFTRVPGTTRVCLEPTPGEAVCNTDAGQGGALDDASLWSGQTLTVAPTAGLFTAATNLGSGLLETGKKRWLNLHECHYYDGSDRFFVTADPDLSGTNVANTADAAATCTGPVGSHASSGSELLAVDLFGQRYLNLHDCHFNFFADHIFLDADASGTNASNVADSSVSCSASTGSHNVHPDSFVGNLDLFGRRYLNLWECRYTLNADTISFNVAYGLGSNTSDVPDGSPSCPAMNGTYSLDDSDHLALDLLDSTRGRGFVEVEVMVSSGAGDFDVDVTLDAAEFAQETDTGTVSVMGTAVPAPDPEVAVAFSHDCGTTVQTTGTPYPGETFLVRVYYINEGDLPGTGASITTTVPAGYSRVPGTTRVCLDPTRVVASDEVVCNTDEGQGGPIDEDAVWTGQTLQISPTAGLLGGAPDATSGLLDIGRKQWLNFHECHYYNGFDDRLFLNVDDGAAGTNASNTEDADADAVCGATSHGRNLVAGLVDAHDITGQAFLNLHECQYQFFFFDRIFLNGSSIGGTNVSSVADTALTCAPTAGAHLLLPNDPDSVFQAIDLRGKRWLNLHECVYALNNDRIAINLQHGVGTSASDEADTEAQCPAMAGGHALVDGSVTALDLLDPTRAQGFVEFWVTSDGTATTDIGQTAELTMLEVPPVTRTSTIESPTTTGLLFRDGFECTDLSRWSLVDQGSGPMVP